MLKANGHPLHLPQGGQIQVMRDPMSGGVRISLAGHRDGNASFVLSPRDAVGFATALLHAAGVEVSFETAFGPLRTDAVP